MFSSLDQFRDASCNFVDRLDGGEISNDPRNHTNDHETEFGQWQMTNVK